MPFYFYLGYSSPSYSSGVYSFYATRPLAINTMNTELPPFKNEEHNSESAYTLNRDITPLNLFRMERLCSAGVSGVG